MDVGNVFRTNGIRKWLSASWLFLSRTDKKKYGTIRKINKRTKSIIVREFDRRWRALEHPARPRSFVFYCLMQKTRFPFIFRSCIRDDEKKCIKNFKIVKAARVSHENLGGERKKHLITSSWPHNDRALWTSNEKKKTTLFRVNRTRENRTSARRESKLQCNVFFLFWLFPETFAASRPLTFPIINKTSQSRLERNSTLLEKLTACCRVFLCLVVFARSEKCH